MPEDYCTGLGTGLRSVPLLHAQGLTYRADDKTLIDVEDLALCSGGPTLILGPNGAGKSLLLRLLHGLIPPTQGQITGTDVRQAMVFQRPVLLRRSVAANVDYALRAANLPRGRTADHLAEAGLADKARQPARSLSGGEQQRLAIVRALATEPKILFLDEPTSSLDPAATLAIESLIQSAARAGIKIVMVSHDPGQARRLAAGVVFLHHGRVLEHVAAPKFFSHPQHPAARAYLAGGLLI